MRDRLFITLMLCPRSCHPALFYGYPMLDNVRISFTDLSFLGMKFGGDWVGLDNYRDLFQPRDGPLAVQHVRLADGDFGRHPPGLGSGHRASVQLARSQRLQLDTVAKIAILVPWATPPIVATIIWRWLLDSQGTINRVLIYLGLISDPVAFFADMRTVWPSVITIMVWNTIPLMILSLLASLQAVPHEIYEAAELDGAGRGAKFRFVTLPFLQPTIVVLGAHIRLLDLQQFRLCVAGHWRRAGYLYERACNGSLYPGFCRFSPRLRPAIGVIMALLMSAFGVVYFRLVGRRQIEEVM